MLSDAQFFRLSRGATVPRKPDDRRLKARVPFSAQIRVYPITGKGQFGSALSVRCRDLSASGVSFLWQKPLEKGANVLMRFAGASVAHPFNIIGSIIRTERVTPSLYVIAARFDAVPVEEPLAASGAPETAVSAEHAFAASAQTNKAPTDVSFEPPPAEVTSEEPKLVDEVAADDELARIRAAVLL